MAVKQLSTISPPISSLGALSDVSMPLDMLTVPTSLTADFTASVGVVAVRDIEVEAPFGDVLIATLEDAETLSANLTDDFGATISILAVRAIAVEAPFDGTLAAALLPPVDELGALLETDFTASVDVIAVRAFSVQAPFGDALAANLVTVGVLAATITENFEARIALEQYRPNLRSRERTIFVRPTPRYWPD